MENQNLRIRLVSFKDSAKQNLDTLYYVKKLRQLPSNNDGSVILEPSDLASALVVGQSETFDWNINEGKFCQILFLPAKSRPIVRGDVVLWLDHLINLLNDQRHHKEAKTELPCSMTLQRDYHFEFSVQLVENSPADHLSSTTKKNKKYDKISTRQLTRGHPMKLKQFNHPVFCAICHKFIWGLHHQGFECEQCSLVTHKKCQQRIPFWCQKSPNPEPAALNGTARYRYDVAHTFKPHEAPFVRALVTRYHSHCNHCGSQILRNALKCTQPECQLIIHEHCKSNVPPMCATPYNSLGRIMSDNDIINNATRRHDSKPITDPYRDSTSSSTFDFESDNDSISSSFDLTWLGPLPDSNMTLLSLPKLDHFEYIGRLGDGAFAKVYCVQHLPSEKYLAIKVVDGKNEQARQQLEVERQILFRYSQGSPYMIKAYCTFHKGTNLFMVMELAEGGTLHHKIQKARMSEDEMRFYLAELVSVIQYLHSKNIVYRDLKLEHAIVCSAGHIRLVDYGLGRFLKTPDELCYTFCGTYSYMAPEVRCLEKDITTGYSYPADFWALGIMFIQMLCSDVLDFPPQMFDIDNGETSEPKNLADIIELPRYISREARACVAALLENDPEKRLGSPNSPHGPIRDHAFFKAGHRIDWLAVDDGIFKPLHKNPIAAPILSDVSAHHTLLTLTLDRGIVGKSGWLDARQSTCSSAEEEQQFKSFDYINQSLWLELIESDIL